LKGFNELKVTRFEPDTLCNFVACAFLTVSRAVALGQREC
jgi:hypothetical protein